MSIQAMNWARQIKAGSCSAKAVLMTVADYADEFGHGFPSLGRIATETEQSVDTVRRRLRDFEGAGVLVRILRNTKDGRRTSDEIRLRIDIEPALLSEAIAAAGGVAQVSVTEAPADDAPAAEAATGEEFVPDDRKESALPSQPATLADCQGDPSRLPGSPSQALLGSSLNCENNNTPLSPQNAELDRKAVELDFSEFAKAWPEPSLKPDLAHRLWQALTAAERREALDGIAIVIAHVKRSRSKLPEMSRWLRGRGWEGLGGKAPVAAAVTGKAAIFIAEGTAEFDAWSVWQRIAHRWHPAPSWSQEAKARGWWQGDAWPPLGRDLPADEKHWVWVDHGTPQWWAWVERLRELGVDKPPIKNGGPREWDSRGRTGLLVGDGPGWWFPTEWPPPKNLGTGGAAAPAARPTAPNDVENFIGH